MLHKNPERFFIAWLCCWSAICYANTSLTQDMLAYDFVSLGISALAGLAGGAARTLLYLMARANLVGNTRLLLVKDLVVSLVCGVIGYVIVQGWNEFASVDRFGIELPAVTKDLRLLVLLVCGYAPKWAFSKVHSLAEAAANRAQKTIQGNPDPITDVAPLGKE